MDDEALSARPELLLYLASGADVGRFSVGPALAAAAARAGWAFECYYDELRRVGEAANAAADRFDVDRIVGELEALYERVLTGRTRKGFDSSIYRNGYRRYFKADETSDPFHRLYEQKRRAVLRGFADHEGLTIVDVGGGYGRLAGPLARTHSVTLVDISPEMLEEARSSLPPEVAIVRADARQLPFG